VYVVLACWMDAHHRNECTDAINRILDTISTTTDIPVLTQVRRVISTSTLSIHAGLDFKGAQARRAHT
jgi:hypothetical protein